MIQISKSAIMLQSFRKELRSYDRFLKRHTPGYARKWRAAIVKTPEPGLAEAIVHSFIVARWPILAAQPKYIAGGARRADFEVEVVGGRALVEVACLDAAASLPRTKFNAAAACAFGLDVSKTVSTVSEKDMQANGARLPVILFVVSFANGADFVQGGPIFVSDILTADMWEMDISSGRMMECQAFGRSNAHAAFVHLENGQRREIKSISSGIVLCVNGCWATALGAFNHYAARNLDQRVFDGIPMATFHEDGATLGEMVSWSSGGRERVAFAPPPRFRPCRL